MLTRQAVLVSLLILCGSIGCAATIDAGLYTTYTIPDKAKTELDWVVCGSVGNIAGCYASGSLSPFGKIGSILKAAKATTQPLAR